MKYQSLPHLVVRLNHWVLLYIQWWRRYLIVWLWMQISLPIIYQMTNPIPPMESPGNSASDGGVTCPNWLDISKVIEKRKMSFFFHSSRSKIDICCDGGPTPVSQQLDEESGEASSQKHEKEGPGPGSLRMTSFTVLLETSSSPGTEARRSLQVRPGFWSIFFMVLIILGVTFFLWPASERIFLGAGLASPSPSPMVPASWASLFHRSKVGIGMLKLSELSWFWGQWEQQPWLICFGEFSDSSSWSRNCMMTLQGYLNLFILDYRKEKSAYFDAGCDWCNLRNLSNLSGGRYCDSAHESTK